MLEVVEWKCVGRQKLPGFGRCNWFSQTKSHQVAPSQTKIWRESCGEEPEVDREVREARELGRQKAGLGGSKLTGGSDKLG